MARPDRVSRRRSDTNARTILAALLGVALGVFLLWLADRSFVSREWQSIVTNVGGIVIATALLTVGWELIGKRAFADEVLAKARLSTDVVAAGIERVTDQYLEDVEWASLIEGATKVDIVVAYASTWRNTHRERLQKIANTRSARMRIFLPDPDDAETMSILAGRFNMTSDDVAGRIREAIADFSAMSRPDGADMTVFVRGGDVVFSCYRFDSLSGADALLAHAGTSEPCANLRGTKRRPVHIRLRGDQRDRGAEPTGLPQGERRRRGMTEHDVQVTRGDLDENFYWHAMESPVVAWDIETSGLDWSTDRIGTCQIATAQTINIVLLDRDSDEHAPKRLTTLLESSDTRKVFHHAPFDLRFMTFQWHVNAANIGCTKVASKILNPELVNGDHSLMPVLQRHLGVTITKAEQRSDWLHELTDDQMRYAANDVAYLLPLAGALESECQHQGLDGLLRASWEYLPTRVLLDLHGSGDVFSY